MNQEFTLTRRSDGLSWRAICTCGWKAHGQAAIVMRKIREHATDRRMPCFQFQGHP